jgi:hypothetical protein
MPMALGIRRSFASLSDGETCSLPNHPRAAGRPGRPADTTPQPSSANRDLGFYSLATMHPALPLTVPAGTRRLPWRVVGCAGLLLLSAVAVLVAPLLDPYRRAPSPDGMVLRVALGEVLHPMDGLSLALADPGRAAFRVRRISPGRELTETFEVEYPSGRTVAVGADENFENASFPALDLDGDGTEDRVVLGEGVDAGLVRIVAGASGATLFEYVDESEYFYGRTAFALGDLDGDGYGELALLHPRRNRNAYDMQPADVIPGIRSYVTVISGSRLR